MCINNRERDHVTTDSLQRVIEPLASYICAAEHPRAALDQAFSLLFKEVAQVNRVARAQVARFAQTSAKIAL
jgi:hypothetical protein